MGLTQNEILRKLRPARARSILRRACLIDARAQNKVEPQYSCRLAEDDENGNTGAFETSRRIDGFGRGCGEVAALA